MPAARADGRRDGIGLTYMRASNIALVALVLLGCTESHGRVPDVDGDAPIISLDGDQWARFCLWRQELRGTEPLRYECDEEGNVLPGECLRTDCRTWDWADCVSGIRSLDDVFPASRVTCTGTVDAYAACVESLVRVPCAAPLRDVTPECSAFWATCPPVAGSDAGVDRD